MPRKPSPSAPVSAPPPDPALVARIVAAARKHFFAHGVRGVTMDQLARDLGMSKKTLYACFPSKPQLLDAVLLDKFQGMRAELDQITSRPGGKFQDELRQLLACLQRQTAEIQPPLVRDLRLLSPDVFARIETHRRAMIQTYFGQLFARGQRAGAIRSDISTQWMIDILLAAVQVIANPATITALDVSPQTAMNTIISVVLEGVMTRKPRAKK
ncbi:MAG: TetR/AcrR family transcriptional regulator [Pirellulales bacterium]|nr:TetR/AcrR family transcriptional regulator [Pirellulales bacterium]